MIAALDPIGFGPKVMQSNNDFGVAATFSVNAHGWPVTHGPMGATVREVTMVLADGSLVTASRDTEPRLFAAAMGGYGLIGLITEMVVEMAPNRNLDAELRRDAGGRFRRGASSHGAGRPAVEHGLWPAERRSRASFFEDALLISYRPSADQAEVPAAAGSGVVSKVSRLHLPGPAWQRADQGPALGDRDPARAADRRRRRRATR